MICRRTSRRSNGGGTGRPRDQPRTTLPAFRHEVHTLTLRGARGDRPAPAGCSGSNAVGPAVRVRDACRNLDPCHTRRRRQPRRNSSGSRAGEPGRARSQGTRVPAPVGPPHAPRWVPSQVPRSLDAALLTGWVRAATEALERHRAEMDRINVFPVPDGDTGTNLLLTMRSAAESLRRGPRDGKSAGSIDDDPAVGPAPVAGAPASPRPRRCDAERSSGPRAHRPRPHRPTGHRRPRWPPRWPGGRCSGPAGTPG